MIVTQENSGIALSVPTYILHNLAKETVSELAVKITEKVTKD